MSSENSNVRQAFKATALIGSGQFINMASGVLRNKALAVLLGPAGIGVAGMYLSTANIVSTVATLGINQSGVQQVSEARASDDPEKLAAVAAIIRRTLLVTGLAATILSVVFCQWLARVTFDADGYAGGMALVSLSVLFGVVAGGEAAILQGMQRFKAIVHYQVANGLLVTAASIAFVYLLGQRGIALYLVTAAAGGGLLVWIYGARACPHGRIPPTAEALPRLRGLVKLGGAFLATSLLGAAVAYFSRVIIVNELGLDGSGLYQASWTVSSQYVGLLLGAMSAEFFPRLSASASDHAIVNRTLNEQIQMGLLMSLPIILAMILLAPWIIQALFSNKFLPATEVIRWQLVGCLFRLVSWPLWHVPFAKANSTLILCMEIGFTLFQLGSLWVFLHAFGLAGLGPAFACAYLFHILETWAICRAVTAFRFSMFTMAVLLPSAVAAVLAVLAARLLAPAPLLAVAALVLTASGALCLYALQRLLGVSLIDRIKRRLLPS